MEVGIDMLYWIKHIIRVWYPKLDNCASPLSSCPVCPGKQEESLPRERQLEKLPIGERGKRGETERADESERMMFHIRPSQFRLRARPTS